MVLLAAAGAGKTTSLVERVLRKPERRVLFTTYTLENLSQIEEMFVRRHGVVPANVTLMSWYSFLLTHLVRPYQRNFFPEVPRIQGLHFDEVPQQKRYVKKTEASYYLTDAGQIYRDRLSAFAFEVNVAAAGAVMRRLEAVYDWVVIDELQDLAGYDLDLLELLFDSAMRTLCCGDVRQATYATNNHSRNGKYRWAGMNDWLHLKRTEGRIVLAHQAKSRRCNPEICAYANAIFPDLPECESDNQVRTGHDGVFFIRLDQVDEYVKEHRPQILRYSRAVKAPWPGVMNYGQVKGRTYERVLILPTKGIRKFVKSGNHEDIGDREKFYVAVTRARASVAIVVN